MLGGHRRQRGRGGAARAGEQAGDRRPARARRGAHRRSRSRRSTAGSSTRRSRRRARRSRSAQAIARRGPHDPRRGGARDRLAPVRDGHRAGPRPPRLRAVRAAAPARPARRPAGPRTGRGAPGVALGAQERREWVRRSRDRTPTRGLLRRPLRRRPRPVGFETSPYEPAKYDATIAALEDRRFANGLEIGCSIGVLTERLAHHVRRPAGDRRRRGRARPRPRARSRTSAFERREVPEEFPDGAYDLIVVSEVLYYLDAPAFDATCDAIERTLRRHPARRALAPDRASATRSPATRSTSGCTARFGPPAYSRQDRQVQPRPLRPHAARDRRRRARPRSPPPAPTARPAATATSRCSRPSSTVPYSRPPLSKEFLRGELDDERAADRAGRVVRRARRRRSASAPRPRRSTRTRARHARQRRDAAATTRACSPPAPSRQPLPVPGATEEWVLLLRSLADARVLRDRAEQPRPARS